MERHDNNMNVKNHHENDSHSPLNTTSNTNKTNKTSNTTSNKTTSKNNNNSNNNNNKNTAMAMAILSNLIEEAKKLKTEGNNYFTSQNYEAAEVTYSRGLKVIYSLSGYLKRTNFMKTENSTNGSSGSNGSNGSNNDHDNDNDHTSNSTSTTTSKSLFLLDIITIKVALWSNQSFVLYKLGKNVDADRLCTDALMEIQKGHGHNDDDDKDKNKDGENDGMDVGMDMDIDAQIEDVLLTGQGKLKYRRAQARESMGRFKDAENDLKECLSHLYKMKGKSVHGNSSNGHSNDHSNNNSKSNNKSNNKQQKEINDTMVALTRLRRKMNQKQMNHDNDTKSNSNSIGNGNSTNGSVDSVSASDNGNHDKNNNSLIIQKQEEDKSQNNKNNMMMKVVEDNSNTQTETMEVDNNSDSDVSMKSHSYTNGNIPKSSIGQKQQQQQQQQQNKKTTITYEICPPPEKQRAIIIQLLNQSPLEGEAYFLINYEWWRIWCRHVNLFMDYEYIALSESTSSSFTNASDQQRWQEDMSRLEKMRQGVLKLLPNGASIPQLACESKKRKLKKMSDDDSTNMESVDSSSEEEDSDCDSVTGDRMKYGPSPGVINNSQLQFQIPKVRSTVKTNNISDASTLFHYEWSHTTKRESMTGENYILRPRLVHGHHFEILPREVYAALRCWYGESTPNIYRRAINRNGKIEVCMYPELQRNERPSPVRSTNADSDRDTHFCGACKAPHAKLRCSNCASIYYCSHSCQASHWPYHKAECKAIVRHKRQRKNDKDFTKYLSIDPSKDPRWGVVGLSNLGNTCFMNAALQCLSHSAPLTRHFLTNRYKDDLNVSNALGAGGKLANAYAIMIKEIWMSKNKAAISPTALKRAIAIFAPRFSGMSQHDSQEFLAFLLDGLHEDLNRIKNPPYVEKPDVTNEQKLSIAGEESWDAHCLRNRSVVMDTFYGQFKSTCVCPRCERVSVSFDAFNHLSLEIPQRRNENTRIVAVLLFSTSSSEPIRYAITLSKNGRMFDIKANLSKITGLPIERIALCDIYDNSIYEIYQDNKNVSVIEKDDIVAAYEIDPYSTSIIHAISTHWKYKTLPQSEEENMTIQRRLIGYPMLSSFGIDLSCREVWHHYCRRMSYIFPEAEEEERLQLLKLRLVNANGKPIAVFGKSSSLEQEMNSIDSFSIIPQTDEKLASFLDNDCAESFLFISIEWNFSNESQNAVDEKRFNLFSNDSSVIEAIRKQQRSMNTNITLENCLEQFTLPEQLDEDNKWYCSACKKHVRAEKTMELWRLPNILIVHMKRFEFKHSLRREKLETLIDCPLEGLEMGKYCAPTSHDGDFAKQKEFVLNGVPACYDLFAVVNHYGRMGFGHYTAFARRWTEDTMSDDWALFDDSSVRRCTKGQVVSSAAYVLFYRRRVFI